MNRITYFTLILFAAIPMPVGHAQSVVKTSGIESVTLTTTPVVAPKRIEVGVGSNERDKAKISLIAKHDVVQVTGVVPTFCSNLLLLKDVSKESAEEKGSETDSLKDLGNLATHVGLHLSFLASDDMKSLTACLNAHQADLEKTDLSRVSSLSKNSFESNEIADAGFVDDNGKVILDKNSPKSEAYLTLLNKKDSNCASCNIASMDSMLALKIPAVVGIVEASLAANLFALSERIMKAKTLSELEKLRTDLVAYSKFIARFPIDDDKKDSLAADVGTKFEELLTRNNQIAFNRPKHAADHANFIASTYGMMAGLPGVSSDSRDEALALQKSFEAKGMKRLDFLSSVDPTNKEVTLALNDHHFLDSLAQESRMKCGAVLRNNPHAQCNAAENFKAAFAEMKNLGSRYDEAKMMEEAVDGRSLAFNFSNQMTGMAGFQQSGFQPRAQQGPCGMCLPSNVFPNADRFNTQLQFGNFQGNSLYNQNQNIYQVGTNAQNNGSYGVNQNQQYSQNQSQVNTHYAIPINLNYSVQPNQNGFISSNSNQAQGTFNPSFNFSGSNS